MKNKFLQYVLSIHHRMPYGLRKSYLPVIKGMRTARSFILPLYCFEGEEFSTGEPLKIAYLGWDEKIENYWLKKLFRKQKQTGEGTYIPLWSVQNYFQRNTRNFDIAIIETNKITRKFIPSNSGFLLPRWLELQMNVEKSLKIMSRTEFQKLFQRNNLTFEKRSSEADFRLFYERMYLPYISVRHKNTAILADYNQFLNNIFRKKGSQLYFIMKDGEPVAGSIDETKEDYVRMSGIGVLDGREDIKKMGAITAAYYFQALEYYHRKIKSVNIGGTSPILTDGLTFYKHSLGAQLFETVRSCENYIWLVPLTHSPAIRRALSANPFISIRDNRYQRNIFVDPGEGCDKKYVLDTLNRTNFDNIKATRIFCFNNMETVNEWIHNAGYKEVKVVPY